ncbi:hypothetical protein [Streptomyces sp. SLBN-115]|uniref:hypothetical protein n=1 Tax=Streptomyces sp. SLBN-115 TaxID=2768453 RepID=UPI00114FD474|nr:hypothetical protein [Streptomyces sp. SLBN-115]TQJ37037.1 hypothetical protein FBY34_8539 [Streptomyces sp. SLBN-115]
MRWHGQLRRLLLSREGGGTVLMAASTAIALGVVPSILEQWTKRQWVFVAVFVGALVLVLAGWVLQRPRGLGVVVSLYPVDRTQASRVVALKNASRAAHSATLVIDRAVLWPREHSGQGRSDVADFVARLIDAQIEELHTAGRAEPEVALYVLAHLQDGFLLGRRLADDVQLSLTVMHLSQQTERSVVLGVGLSSSLRAALSPEQRGRLSSHLAAPAPGRPHLVEIPDAAGQQRHRIALIVRMASAGSMVDDARHVATTGQVAYGPEHHTGYELPLQGPDRTNGPCGAYLVIDTGNAYLPDDSTLYAAVTTYVWECWQAAQQEWAQRLGGTTAVEGLLFFHGPLPVAVALGWLTARDRLTLVHHDLRLAHGTTTPPAAGP